MSESGHGIHGHITAEVLIAGNTKVSSELEIIEPAGSAFKEIFLGKSPAGGNSGEISPFIVDAEFGGTFISEGCGEKIFTHIIIIDAAEEGNQLGIVFI